MSHTIYVYDEIGAWGVTAESIADQLDDIHGGDILVRINSPGGDVFDGLAIYNLLRGRREKVTTQIDGWAASAASVIAMAGDSISMAANSFMMIHAPWTIHGGNASDFRRMADQLEAVQDSLVDTYVARRNLPRDRVAAWVAAETMFSAQEAIDAGMADRVVAESAVAASASIAGRGLPCPEHPAVAARRAERKKQIAIAAAGRRRQLDRHVNAANEMRWERMAADKTRRQEQMARVLRG